MKTYIYPKKQLWKSLAERPLINNKQLNPIIGRILRNVEVNGDKALFDYTKKFDNVQLKDLKVSPLEFEKAESKTANKLKTAIELAYQNIYAFHKEQKQNNRKVETTQGVKCWRKAVGIERVGIYIPAGEAPLFSSVLMLGIPAILAKCKRIILCTPVQNDGTVNSTILYTAKRIGIKNIYKVGGAQAIGAMAYGTTTIPRVDKIFGPGNQYVTKAKELIQQSGTAIDLPAGPSEVLVIADKTANPSFVAADLLSQAEHGQDSQVMLVSTSNLIIKKVLTELTAQLKILPRRKIVEKALYNSKAIKFKSINECVEFSNLYAPEHLIIATRDPENISENIVNAGSVFLGNYSCESAGDYASGTNHTLPTNGFARNYSGVSLDSFTKKITFQKITKQGLLNIGESIEIMAQAEQLQAHKNAVSIRLKTISNE